MCIRVVPLSGGILDRIAGLRPPAGARCDPRGTPTSPVAAPTCVRCPFDATTRGAGPTPARRIDRLATRIRLQRARNHLPDHSQVGYEPAGRAFAPSIWGMSAKLGDAALVQVGTLDDSSISGRLQMVILTIDKQSFHYIPDGLSVFERVPG